MKYKVIVAGGGPAGLWVAYNLVRRGINNILVLEKDGVGQNSICGGAVDKRVIEKWMEDINSVNLVDKVMVRFNNRNFYFRVPSISIFKREELDVAIKRSLPFNTVKEGIEAVNFEEHADRVSVYTNKGEFLCDYFVIATGPASSLLKNSRLGFHVSRNKFAIGERYIVENENHFFKDRLLFDFSDNLYGYRWIFPFSGGLNVGNGKFVKHNRDILHDLKEFTQKENIPFLRKSIKGAPIPMEIPSYIATNRVAVIGDSAGMVNPVTGGGLTLSYYFSEKITGVIEKGISLKHYERLVHSSNYYKWCRFSTKTLMERNSFSVKALFSLFTFQFKLLSIKKGI